MKRKRNDRQLELFERMVAETLTRGLSVLVERERAKATSRLPGRRKGTIRKRPVPVTAHVRWIVDKPKRRPG